MFVSACMIITLGSYIFNGKHVNSTLLSCNIISVYHCLLYTAQLILECYTNTAGSSLVGWSISLFYSTNLVSDFRCALNDGELQLCMLTHDWKIMYLKF